MNWKKVEGRHTSVQFTCLAKYFLTLQYEVKYGVVDTECFLQPSLPPDPKTPLKVRNSHGE